MKAPKNKTIDLSVEEGAAYLRRCVEVNAPAALDAVLDAKSAAVSKAV